MNWLRMGNEGLSQAEDHSSGKSEASVGGSEVTAWLGYQKVGENGEHLWAVLRAWPLF